VHAHGRRPERVPGASCRTADRARLDLPGGGRGVGAVAAAVALRWPPAIVRGCVEGGLALLAICTIVILLSFGAATFFSPGGMRMLLTILVTWTCAEGKAGAGYA